jgi:putative spermidine/putrescine transport system substrate-binding protein
MDRRTFVRGGIAAAGLLCVSGAGGLLSACAGPSEGPSGDASAAVVDFSDWDAVVEAARGTTVTHAGYSGDDKLNEWIVGPLTSTLKEKYDITLKYAKDVDTTTFMVDNKAGGGSDVSGSFDTAWVNGATFKIPQEQGLWFGPLTPLLPNFSSYLDADEYLFNYDFTYPIEGYEAPFSSAQIIFINDAERTPETPASVEELLAFAKKYPGTVTYPTSDDWLGAAFIRTVIYNIVGYEQFQDMAADYDTVKEAVAPAMEYLRELNPYLWREGTTFPADHDALESMFLSGECNFVITYGTYDCGISIKSGLYPQTAQAFIFDKGTCANVSYWAVAWDAPNKPGALVLVNEMLSPEMQLEKARAGEPFVVDLSKVDSELAAAFESVDNGPNNVPDDVLRAHALPEYSADIEALVTRIWKEEVLGASS